MIFAGVKEKSNEQMDVLKNFIQENTEKLGFLKILFEEHAKLWKTLKIDHKSEVKTNNSSSIFFSYPFSIFEIINNTK